jgi:arabinan endo-1,5-alpha-L-arabinosidase
MRAVTRGCKVELMSRPTRVARGGSLVALACVARLFLACGSGDAPPGTGSVGAGGDVTGSGGGGTASTGGATGGPGGNQSGTGGNVVGDASASGSGGGSSTGGADAQARDAAGRADARGGGTGNDAGSTPVVRGDAGPGSPPPIPIATHLAIGVHDPSMIHTDNGWYLFATGGTLGVRSSQNMTQYANAGSVFSAVPSWVNTELGATINALWAPDISFWNGKYHVYYAGSTFGSNHSVIGLATNTTLDRAAAGYAWVDEGLVIESNPGGGRADNWNAIDPNLAFDAQNNAWLVFGSFWSGIKMRLLDGATGKLATTDTTLYGVAGRNGGAIEAPSIVDHNGYYYLFVSYDICCQGVNSTYRTMVGRSQGSITGPYLDKAGAAMMQGNAEQLLATDGRYIGPGGGTAFRDGNYYYYAYHYYDGQSNGDSHLAVRPLTFDGTDWPALGDMLWQ